MTGPEPNSKTIASRIPATPRDVASTVRSLALVVALAGILGLHGCRAFYQRPPTVGEGDGLRTKVVRAKREPDRLIAEDLTVCWVVPDVFKGIRPGDHWRCDWRYVPAGM